MTAGSRKLPVLAGGMLIFTVFVALQVTWCHLDHWPISSDPVQHYQYLQHVMWKVHHAPGQLLPFSNAFPPLLYVVSIPTALILGVKADSAILSLIPFSLMLFVATYYLARGLFDRLFSLLAATLVLFFPMNLVLSRMYYTDYALEALVALSFAVLVPGPAFRSPVRSVVLGLSIGLGMLTRWT
jgi:4-amino-4-deoxy-L-arabinose transferase-like glycosyltransferase